MFPLTSHPLGNPPSKQVSSGRVLLNFTGVGQGKDQALTRFWNLYQVLHTPEARGPLEALFTPQRPAAPLGESTRIGSGDARAEGTGSRGRPVTTQDLKGSIRVFCRVRPLSKKEQLGAGADEGGAEVVD